MRFGFLLLGVVITTAAAGTGARAQNYPWCADYDGSFGGRNCGFTTLEQCQATVSGIGGFCNRNNTYVPPTRAAPSHRAKRKSPANS